MKSNNKGLKITLAITTSLAVIAIAVMVAVIIINTSNGGESTISSSDSKESQATQPEKEKITIPDFNGMTKDEVQEWFDSNKVSGMMFDEYSDTVKKGEYTRQTPEANSKADEDVVVFVYFSLGKAPTMEQKNALSKATTYANSMNMSKQGVYDQLVSEYGEGFSKEAAQYAIDNVEADWKKNALEKAKIYQTNMHMSKNRIYEQLTSKYGEQFTKEEAQYAIDNLPD